VRLHFTAQDSYPTSIAPQRTRYIIIQDRIRIALSLIKSQGRYTQLLSGPIPELIHPLTEWIRSYPIRHRSLYILSQAGSDPIRSDAGAYTPSSGIELTGSDPIPESIHPLPEWARPYPTRYRSLYIIFRCEADTTRSDPGVCILSSGMDPILSDPMQKLIHPLSEWIRSYPIRYQSLYPFFQNGSDPIRSNTGAYSYSSEMDPTLSDPIL
jgi:hypothetical protein